MHFGYASSYVMEVHKGNISEEKAIVVLMRTMMILVILMTMLGLTGMSVYFASERRPEIAIRKIFGGTIETETVRNIKKSGSWFSYGESKLAQGREAVKQMLTDNIELCEEIEAKIREALLTAED